MKCDKCKTDIPLCLDGHVLFSHELCQSCLDTAKAIINQWMSSGLPTMVSLDKYNELEDQHTQFREAVRDFIEHMHNKMGVHQDVSEKPSPEPDRPAEPADTGIQ